MSYEKNLIQSRGYMIIKLGGTDRAVINPLVFPNKKPTVEAITRDFIDRLKTEPVRVLELRGKTVEERDELILKTFYSKSNE